MMHWAVRTTLGGRAVAIPGSDATCQDALDGAAVKRFEDLKTHAKSFQSPKGEYVLSCPLVTLNETLQVVDLINIS